MNATQDASNDAQNKINRKLIEYIENQNELIFSTRKRFFDLEKIQKRDCIFLHCLPRGSEVSDEIFLGNKSHVWQQALNRVHVQKSILLYCFGKLR